MKGHSNFLPCFGVIQDVLGLIEMGQNAVTIQVPSLIQNHLSCIGNRKVALYKNPESQALDVFYNVTCHITLMVIEHNLHM